MSDVEITIKLPEELVEEADEFGVLTEDAIVSLLRDETDRRIMEFVNAEIKAYRAEKRNAEKADSD